VWFSSAVDNGRRVSLESECTALMIVQFEVWILRKATFCRTIRVLLDDVQKETIAAKKRSGVYPLIEYFPSCYSSLCENRKKLN
jgi:hypothetical protein